MTGQGRGTPSAVALPVWPARFARETSYPVPADSEAKGDRPWHAAA